jgi:hypothetical protein
MAKKKGDIFVMVVDAGGEGKTEEGLVRMAS